MDQTTVDIVALIRALALAGGAILSWLMENFGPFKALDPNGKKIWTLIINVVVGILAAVAGTLLVPDQVQKLAGIITVIISILFSLFGNQAYHVVINRGLKRLLNGPAVDVGQCG